MMQIENVNDELEAEWSPENGFLWKLRQGHFDQEGFHRLVNILQLANPQGDLLDRRFVSLTWILPLFMSWQEERLEENGYDLTEYRARVSQIEALVQEILGIP